MLLATGPSVTRAWLRCSPLEGLLHAGLALALASASRPLQLASPPALCAAFACALATASTYIPLVNGVDLPVFFAFNTEAGMRRSGRVAISGIVRCGTLQVVAVRAVWVSWLPSAATSPSSSGRARCTRRSGLQRVGFSLPVVQLSLRVWHVCLQGTCI